jgi:hypothetical protein
MTANELADELQKLFVGEEYDRLVHEIPDLLRQQAQEIEQLKALAISLSHRNANIQYTKASEK